MIPAIQKCRNKDLRIVMNLFQFIDMILHVDKSLGMVIAEYGTMVYVSEAAAAESGVDVEIIDLRSIWPLDLETIVNSVKKTGRCVVVHEATRTSGFGAELVSLIQEHCFYHLEAPIERVAGWDTPYPHAQEWAYFPGPKRVAEAFKRAMEA